MKIVVNKENPTGTEVEETAVELSQMETDKTQQAETKEANRVAKENNATLKASAKAKLIAGEALTEAEADTIIL